MKKVKVTRLTELKKGDVIKNGFGDVVIAITSLEAKYLADNKVETALKNTHNSVYRD